MRHCPDVNFLLLLYAAVFLIKVKASNTRFSSLVDDGELQHRLTQCIVDCRNAGAGERHASATCSIMLRALLASWKAIGAAGAHDALTEFGVGDSSAMLHPRRHLSGIDTPTGPPSTAPYAFLASPFANGGTSGTRTPNGGVGANNYGYGLSDPLDHFLADTNFFNSVLVSQGADGFFSWADSMGSAGAAGMVDGDEWMKLLGDTPDGQEQQRQ